MQMKLSQLRVFLEIVRTGGVRSAAAALHLSQSAVTKSLAQLESECGVALFIRTGRGLLPTEEGERLLPCAQAVLANVERAESVIADASRLRRSRLRVAIAPTVPTEVVRSAVRTFRTRFPETELTFSSGLFSDAAPLILTDKLDLALVILSDLTRREVGRLDIESLFTVGYGLVARRGHPILCGADPQILARSEWLTTNRPEVAQGEVAEVAAKLGIPTPARITCCDMHAYTSLIEGADAVSISPLSILEEPPLAGRLAALPRERLALAPLTGAFASRRDAELPATALYMKHALRTAIGEWLEAHPHGAIRSA